MKEGGVKFMIAHDGMGVASLDPRCAGLAHVLGEGQRVPGLRHALSNSFAFGGTNVALVFSRA